LPSISSSRSWDVKVRAQIHSLDNQGAISLAKNPTHHAKTKHVDVQLHFLSDYVEKHTIDVEYYPSNDMLADLMTKGLARDKHVDLTMRIGMGNREATTTTTPSSFEDNRSTQSSGTPSATGRANYPATEPAHGRIRAVGPMGRKRDE
jgi:hypothetical protein